MKNVIDLSRSYRMSHGFSVCFFYFADCYEFSFFCRFAKRFKDLLFFCVAKVPSVSTIMVLYYTRYSFCFITGNKYSYILRMKTCFLADFLIPFSFGSHFKCF